MNGGSEMGSRSKRSLQTEGLWEDPEGRIAEDGGAGKGIPERESLGMRVWRGNHGVRIHENGGGGGGGGGSWSGNS